MFCNHNQKSKFYRKYYKFNNKYPTSLFQDKKSLLFLSGKKITKNFQGTISITLNGYVTNSKKSRQELLNTKVDYDDENFIVQIYIIYGMEGLDKIEGNYSYLLYDSVNSRLLVVRSPISSYCIFYSMTNDNNINVSSDLKLLKDELSKTKLDEEYIANFIVHNENDFKETPFKGIYRIQQGSFLTVLPNKSKYKKFWRWHKSNKQIESAYEVEHEEYLRQLLFEVLSSHIKDITDVGAHLSGGIDSSSIVSILAKIKPLQNIHTISKVFPGDTNADERYFIDKVVKDKKLINHQINLNNAWFLKDIDRIHEIEEPSTDLLFFSQDKIVYDYIASQQIKHVLTGEGGDHLFDMIPFFLIDILKSKKLPYIIPTVIKWAKEFNRSVYWVIKTFLLGESKRKYTERWNIDTGVRRDELMLYTIPPWLNKSYVKKNNLIERCFSEKSDKGFKNHLLMIIPGHMKVVWSAKHFYKIYGIETRHPLLDQRILSFLLNLPLDKYMYPSKKFKPLLTEALKNDLPAEIYHRNSKADFTSRLYKGIREEQLVIRKLTTNMLLEELDILDGEMFRDSLTRWRLGFFGDIRSLFTILSLELWLRKNLL